MIATAYLQYGRVAFILLGINMIQPCNLVSYAAVGKVESPQPSGLSCKNCCCCCCYYSDFNSGTDQKTPAHARIMVSLSGGILSTSQVRTIYTLPIESRRFSPFVLSFAQ